MRAGRTVIGLILIVLGVLFLLDAADVLAAGPVIADWWPLALILIAAVQLITAPRAWLIPAIVIVVGLILLGATLDVLPSDAGTLFWPLVLIAVGVGFLLSHRIGRGSPAAISDREVNAMAAFGGNDIVSQSTAFQGGSLVAAFGGVTLDLRGARLRAPLHDLLHARLRVGPAAVAPPGLSQITFLPSCCDSASPSGSASAAAQAARIAAACAEASATGGCSTSASRIPTKLARPRRCVSP